MTCLQLQMMLWYYCRSEPYGKGEYEHANSGALLEQRSQLIDSDMLEESNGNSGFRVTAKGLFFVEYLQSLPLPC